MKLRMKHWLAFGLSLGISGAVGAEEAAKIYASKCAMCHAKDGKGNAAMAKMKKSDIALWNLVDEATLAKTDEELIAATADGVKPAMPGFKDKISKKDIAALIAYVRSLVPAPEKEAEEKPE